MKQQIATRAFIVKDDTVLIIRQSPDNDDEQAGRWDFPGGRVEPGEAFLDGLHREVKEEAGISVKAKEPFFVAEWHPTIKGEKVQIIGIYFECEPKTLDVQPGDGHDQFLWMPIADYKKHNLMPKNVEAVEAYLKRKH